MMSGFIRGSALAGALLLSGAVSAQSSPPLATMPMPPSASDPLPKEGAKRKPAADKPAAAAKSRPQATGEGGDAAGRTSARRSGAAAPAQNFERPKRYVPAEFDQGGEPGSRAKPFVSETGRPGMGMRF